MYQTRYSSKPMVLFCYFPWYGKITASREISLHDKFYSARAFLRVGEHSIEATGQYYNNRLY